MEIVALDGANEGQKEAWRHEPGGTNPLEAGFREGSDTSKLLPPEIADGYYVVRELRKERDPSEAPF